MDVVTKTLHKSLDNRLIQDGITAVIKGLVYFGGLEKNIISMTALISPIKSKVGYLSWIYKKAID